MRKPLPISFQLIHEEYAIRLTRNQIHRMKTKASPNEVFNALITPSSIQDWWKANTAIVLPQKDGTWAATWGENLDSPDYISSARICVFEPGKQLKLDQHKYFAASGNLPFQANFSVDFRLENKDEETILTVDHDGFPVTSSADAYFEGCQLGWQETLTNLEKFLRA